MRAPLASTYAVLNVRSAGENRIMGPVTERIARRLATVEQDITAVITEWMGGVAPNPRELAVGTRGLVERQVLEVLASVVDLAQDVEREHRSIAARSPIALKGAVYGTNGVTTPEIVRDAVDRMPADRVATLRVAAAIDGELEEKVQGILDESPPPALTLVDRELLDGAHAALDAHDAALIAMADEIERREAA